MDSAASVQRSDDEVGNQNEDAPQVPLNLPEISTGTDLGADLSSIIGSTNEQTEPSEKRLSNVEKLAEENQKLNEELAAMTQRLEAAERKRAEIEAKRDDREQK